MTEQEIRASEAIRHDVASKVNACRTVAWAAVGLIIGTYLVCQWIEVF